MPGRKLHQEHPSAVAELVPAGGDAVDPGLGCVEPLGVSESPGGLDGEQEALGQLLPPAPEGTLRRPPVEAGVELDGAEAPGVEVSAVARCGARWVEHVLPVRIAPTGGADVSHHALTLRSRR